MMIVPRGLLTQSPIAVNECEPVAAPIARIHPATPSWLKNAAGAPIA